MSLLGEAAVENRAGDLPSRVGPTPVEGLRKSDSIRSVGNLGQPVSSEEGPPRAKRARRCASAQLHFAPHLRNSLRLTMLKNTSLCILLKLCMSSQACRRIKSLHRLARAGMHSWGVTHAESLMTHI